MDVQTPAGSIWRSLDGRNRIVLVEEFHPQWDDCMVRNLRTKRRTKIYAHNLRRAYEEITVEESDRILFGESRAPDIHNIQATYYRKGSCARCGRSNVEREKTFTGRTLADCAAQAKAWEREPILHRRCER